MSTVDMTLPEDGTGKCWNVSEC